MIGGSVWDFFFGLLYASLAVQCCRAAIEQLTRRSDPWSAACFLSIGVFLMLDSYIWGSIFAKNANTDLGLTTYSGLLKFLDVVGWASAFVGVELLRHGIDDPGGRTFRGGLCCFGLYYFVCACYWLDLAVWKDGSKVWELYQRAVHPRVPNQDVASVLIIIFFSLGAILWFGVARYAKGDSSQQRRFTVRLAAIGLSLAAAVYLCFLSNGGLLAMAGVSLFLWWCVGVCSCFLFRKKLRAAAAVNRGTSTGIPISDG